MVISSTNLQKAMLQGGVRVQSHAPRRCEAPEQFEMLVPPQELLGEQLVSWRKRHHRTRTAFRRVLLRFGVFFVVLHTCKSSTRGQVVLSEGPRV